MNEYKLSYTAREIDERLGLVSQLSEDIENLKNAGSGSGPIDQVQADWNQNDETAVDFIKNKPFGETTETVTFLDGEYRYYFDEANGFWTHDTIPYTSDARLSIGANVTVTWDGTVYECKCYEYPGIGRAVGSLAPLTGIDDGIPFLIVEDVNGLATGTPGFAFALVADPDQTVTTEVTVAIKLESKITIVKQIDPKYVDVSWGGLPDKPFYHNSGTEAILEETTLPFDVDTAGGSYYGEASKSLIPGQTYIVIWDGQEYEYTAELYDGSPVIGDLQTFRPFGIEMTGGLLVILTTFTESSHTISITRKYDDLKTIDPKYLPTLHYTPPVNELLPEKTFTGFTLDSTWGLYQVNEEDPNYTLKVGETYVVEWDGATYICIGQDVSAIFGVSGSVAIGNGSLVGLASNNEPFIIGKFDGDWKGYISFTDTDSTGSHTVRIYQPAENPGYKIKEEYIPEFARKTLFEEQTVSFEYFLQDTYASTGNPVSFTFNEGESYIVMFDGVEYVTNESAIDDVGATIIGNLNRLTGTDNGMPFSAITTNNGVLVWSAFDTAPSHTVAIYQRVKLIPDTQSSASGLPEVTSADEGKILRVVGGVWSAVALPNAEEASF